MIHSHKKIRFFAACALLLILVIAAGTFMFIQVKSLAASKTASHTAAAKNTRVTPAKTLTVEAAAKPLFYDDFADTSKGWYQGSVPGYTRVIANNTLTLADANHTILPESLPTTSLYHDFQVTVSFTVIQAAGDDSVGLYVRGDSYLDHDYRIDIYGNGTCAISKEILDAGKHARVQYLVGPTTANSLKPLGQPNTVSVMMKGPQLVLKVNGTFVNSVIDRAYTSGQIALFVQNSATSSGVQASFKSVAVNLVPEHLPAG